MRKSLSNLIHKLPSIQQIAGVYAIIVILLYAWTFFWWLWKLNSWLYFLSAVDIASILAYGLATNFFESLFALFVLLALCMILPRKLLSDAFVVRASIGVSLLFGYLMIYSHSFKSIEPKDYPKTLVELAPFVLLSILLITYLVPRIRLLNRMIESFAERAQIFLYFSVPASIVSLCIVVLRNLVMGLRHG